jgi:hypothetical protein
VLGRGGVKSLPSHPDYHAQVVAAKAENDLDLPSRAAVAHDQETSLVDA